MKSFLKLAVTVFALCCVVCLSLGTVSAGEKYRGVQNGCLWELDAATGTLTIDFGEGAPRGDWLPYQNSVKHMVLLNDEVNSGYLNNYFDPELYPNLETVSGTWHHGAYEPSLREDYIKPWKKGDPEVLWKIDLKAGTLSFDAKGNPFVPGYFSDECDFFEHSGSTGVWVNFKNKIHTLVLCDGITSWPSSIDVPLLMYTMEFDTVKVGKNVKAFDGLAYMAKTKYVVDSANPNLAAYNGALYTKDYKTLVGLPYGNPKVQLHPKMKQMGNGTLRGGYNGSQWDIDLDAKTLTLSGKGTWGLFNIGWLFQPYLPYLNRLVIADGVENLYSDVFFYSLKGFDTFVLGKSMKSFEHSTWLPKKEFKVDPQNPNFSVYDGALYTKDYSKLIAVPTKKASLKIHPDTKTIGTRAFEDTALTSIVIIPEGVTKIEIFAFTWMGTSNLVVLPDTLTSIENQSDRHPALPKFIFSDKNKLAAKQLGVNGKIQADLMPDSLKGAQTVSEIYKITQNGQHLPEAQWKTENGKKYYYVNGVKATGHIRIGGKAYFFDQNGVMEHSKWKYDNGNWYYLNSYGAGVVKIWLLSGGKWYFMQADGTMATSKWIQWYNKWYYVGADGAMYANRKTPDGYWVNKNGAWVS